LLAWGVAFNALLFGFLWVNLFRSQVILRMNGNSNTEPVSGSGNDIFFLSVINEIPVPAALYRGENFLIELANDKALALLGRDGSAIGKPLLEVVPELKGQPYLHMLEEVYRTGRVVEGKESLTYIEKDGEMKPVYINFIVKALHDAAGKVSGVISVGYEVTELVIARNKIREVEERSRLAIDSAQLGTFDMNFITGENIFSERFREIFGFINENVSVHQVAGAIHPDDLHISDAANQGILEGGFINYDIRIIHGDRSIRWINTVGKLFTDENANPARFIGVIKDITPEKQAEQRMAMLAGIVQSSADAIISKKLDGTITSWNEAAERIFGYSAKEMVGNNISIIIPPELLEQEEAITERLRRGETVTHFETRRITKNGKLLDISLTISPVKDLKGNVTGASKISRDITAQKRVERHIFESEERLQMVISAADLGTWEIMIPTDEMKISDKVLQIMGYNPGETISRQKTVEHVHPDDRGLRIKSFEQAFRTGNLDTEFRIIRKDGSICWINLQGKVIFNHDNKPVKMMGTMRDITNKIAAMEDLRESELKFRLLADAMPQLIWTSDELGRPDYFNNSFAQYSGLSLQEVGKSGWLQLVHPEEREESVKRWSESVKNGVDFIFEHRFRRRDGEYHWHLTRALPQKNSAGQIQMWVGTSTDIHEQKTFSRELEVKVAERTRDLKEANIGLEKMNQELASFAYVSSHDLQEPLRKIQIFAMHILEKEEKNLSETGRDYFGRMQKAANRMQNLIEDLLVYSRTNTKEKTFELTDLNNILSEVKGELDQLIHEKKAVISNDKLPSLHIIPYQFRQLFTNLISNSLKFSKKAEAPVINISVKKIRGRETGLRSAAPNTFYCHIQIKDNGIGFLSEYNEKIFEVFQRLHGRSEYDGTGIGLAIAKKIVENHNGFIDAQGEQGKGAIFNVYIPFA
jgi:hypothetical protein